MIVDETSNHVVTLFAIKDNLIVIKNSYDLYLNSKFVQLLINSNMKKKFVVKGLIFKFKYSYKYICIYYD